MESFRIPGWVDCKIRSSHPKAHGEEIGRCSLTDSRQAGEFFCAALKEASGFGGQTSSCRDHDGKKEVKGGREREV